MSPDMSAATQHSRAFSSTCSRNATASTHAAIRQRHALERRHPEQGSGRTHTCSDALDVHAVDGAQEVAQQDLAASRSGPRRRKAIYHQPIPTRASARLASIEDYPDADRLGRVCAADVSASFFRGIPRGCGTAAACTHEHAVQQDGASRTWQRSAVTALAGAEVLAEPPLNVGDLLARRLSHIQAVAPEAEPRHPPSGARSVEDRASTAVSPVRGNLSF
jgi:hypothetical protein